MGTERRAWRCCRGLAFLRAVDLLRRIRSGCWLCRTSRVSPLRMETTGLVKTAKEE